MTDSKKAATSKDVVDSGNAGSAPLGDHTAADLADTYRDNPDKPAEDSIAQVQDPPKGWPGTVRAEDHK